ncbi:M56 family metallopeptidase [Dysgonomonas sp. HDW5A]|uniref:M56 family metallopeptidase n=1 Tax=Dysgonomonas sp. HDW5A TaxID=2714926 RepID=UPI00140A87F5|nr:M56 family metallopeptidase [Dysgonomonas sp. HDW5A]QIK61061.1 M56 family metallopeptidase [Dysgonomonas sp. HDW5A]
MENLIISYAVKASLAMILLYGLYVLCFRNDTFNKTKRFYLLFIVLFSLVYPFCKLNIATVGNIAIYEAILPQIEVTDNLQVDNDQTFALGMNDLLLLFFFSGIVVLFVRLFIQLLGIIKLRLINYSQTSLNYRIISLDKTITPFSFFNWIFIPTNGFKQEDVDVMMAHEEEHADQFHSFDILLSELFCILFWWNPIAWLLKREIKINLEYLADKGVLEKGIEAKKYQYLLLQVIKPSATIHIVNNFNVSQLKKRITMINKKRTSGILSFKYLLALPIIALMLIGNAQNTFSQQKEKVEIASLTENPTTSEDQLPPFVMVEQMPQFAGGESAMMQYIGTNLKYPESAAKENIEGRVVLRFVVTKTGDIKDVSVIRGLDSRCDEEAMRVVRAMPKWTPGKQGGKDVDVYYTLPILYKLQKETPKTTN